MTIAGLATGHTGHLSMLNGDFSFLWADGGFLCFVVFVML